MAEGRIIKAERGFWYVETPEETLSCAARGRVRFEGITPLVGDFVEVKALGKGRGSIEQVLPRKNSFIRPAVANVDALVILASAAVPVTDPFLIDRIAAIAELKDCEPILCFHKSDLARNAVLTERYRSAGFTVLETSTVTGEGLSALQDAIQGKLCAFTGNSGVGKSSLLNALEPALALATNEVSEHLGRGRHTTRHVSLYRLPQDTMVIDTPGFAAFEADDVTLEMKKRLPELFREFRPHLGNCRFHNCAHMKDEGCAVLAAVERGEISRERLGSYQRLRAETDKLRDWELR